MDAKKATLTLLIILQLLGGYQIMVAQIGGNGIYKFLDLPFSARNAALGGKFNCVKDDDVTTIAQNPSLLNDKMSNKIALSYVNYFSDINYGAATYARTVDSVGNFSAGLQYIHYGKFTRADEFGNAYDSFQAVDFSINLGYSRDLDSMFSVGAVFKTISSQLDSYSSVGNALDLGATYNNFHRNLAVALVIKNLGYQWKTYVKNNREPFAYEIQLGFSKKPKHVPFRYSIILQHLQKWDLTYIDTENPPLTKDPLTGQPIEQNAFANFAGNVMRHVILGGEFLLTKNFHLRLGYNYKQRKELRIEERGGLTGISFGVGLKVYKFNVSYGYAGYHIAGGANQFTFTFNPSDFYAKK